MPALSNMAGQITQWNRVIPLPTTWRSAGQSLSYPAVGISRRGEVVDERVEPDVDGLIGVAGERNAPGQPLARDGNVLQAILEQTDDLVAPDRRLHAKLARADEVEEPVAIAAQPEEVVALLRRDQLECRVLDAAAVHDLCRLLELLAAGAIESFVLADEEVVRAATAIAFSNAVTVAPMPRLRRPDPVVVTALETPPEGLEPIGHPVHPCLWRETVLLCRLQDRLARARPSP